MSNARKLADNLPTDGQLGNRNVVINSAMQVAQRGTSAVTTSGSFAVDRWKNISNASDFSAQQSTTVPSGQGLYNSIHITPTSTKSPSGSTYFFVSHYIEGFNIARLNWGTSDAKTITLSFWVRSSKTGTYSLGLKNANATRSRQEEYTISAANTWEKKTITVTGETSGSWPIDNTRGLALDFCLAGEGSETSTIGSWISSNSNMSSNQVNFFDSTSNNFYLTGVQLEVGSQASPFEHEPLSVTLDKCYRYTYVFKTNDTNGIINIHQDRLTQGYIGNIFMPVEMRAAPTVSHTGMDRVHKPGIRYDTISSGPNFYFIHTQGFVTTMSVTNNDVDSQTAYFGAVSGGSITADAEL